MILELKIKKKSKILLKNNSNNIFSKNLKVVKKKNNLNNFKNVKKLRNKDFRVFENIKKKKLKIYKKFFFQFFKFDKPFIFLNFKRNQKKLRKLGRFYILNFLNSFSRVRKQNLIFIKFLLKIFKINSNIKKKIINNCIKIRTTYNFIYFFNKIQKFYINKFNKKSCFFIQTKFKKLKKIHNFHYYFSLTLLNNYFKIKKLFLVSKKANIKKFLFENFRVKFKLKYNIVYKFNKTFKIKKKQIKTQQFFKFYKKLRIYVLKNFLLKKKLKKRNLKKIYLRIIQH